MDKSVFRITTEKNVNKSAFCNKICGKTCAIHSLLNHDKKIHQVFLYNNELDCFRVFQHKVLNNFQFEPFIANNECIIICVLKPEHGSEEKPVSVQIDTAAQVSIMSLSFLRKHFSCLKLTKPQKKITLLTADNRSIKISGVYNFSVDISSISVLIKFYIIQQGMTCLLGLPDIVKLGLQINFGVLKDTSSHNPNFMNIQQISHETELSVFKTEITNKESNEMKGAPKIMFFTPLHKIHVPENTLISISLICNDDNIGDYLYFRCLVWDCNCIKKSWR